MNYEIAIFGISKTLFAKIFEHRNSIENFPLIEASWSSYSKPFRDVWLFSFFLNTKSKKSNSYQRYLFTENTTWLGLLDRIRGGGLARISRCWFSPNRNVFSNFDLLFWTNLNKPITNYVPNPARYRRLAEKITTRTRKKDCLFFSFSKWKNSTRNEKSSNKQTKE